MDVSKKKLHVSVRTQDGETLMDGLSVSNDAQGWETLIDQLPDETQNGLVGFEATGGYERGAVRMLNERTDLSTVLLNPHRVLSFARSRGLRT